VCIYACMCLPRKRNRYRQTDRKTDLSYLGVVQFLLSCDVNVFDLSDLSLFSRSLCAPCVVSLIHTPCVVSLIHAQACQFDAISARCPHVRLSASI
jgi:hypothetical protein